MIEINLLPEELQKKKGQAINFNIEASGMRMYIGGFFLGALIFIFLFFLTGTLIRKAQIAKLTEAEKGISAKLSDVEALNKEIADIKSKLGVLDDLTKRRFLWAQKLNQVSELVLPGTWFRRAYTDSENRFIIEGSVISKGEEEMALVGKFMKNIKDDTQFFRDFTNIKLESVQRKNENGMDIVDFTIALYF